MIDGYRVQDGCWSCKRVTDWSDYDCEEMYCWPEGVRRMRDRLEYRVERLGICPRHERVEEGEG